VIEAGKAPGLSTGKTTSSLVDGSAKDAVGTCVFTVVRRGRFPRSTRRTLPVVAGNGLGGVLAAATPQLDCGRPVIHMRHTDLRRAAHHRLSAMVPSDFQVVAK